ncbi:MAG TPA: hypothetical protein PKK10_01400 [Woeseiaceae bacterium]|nr:hypothetical protein [Woeseiaceae bacterium]
MTRHTMDTSRKQDRSRLIGLSIMGLMLLALIAGQVGAPGMASKSLQQGPQASATAEIEARPRGNLH